ncbi:MAG TPA: 3-hydroxyacyl-CoA dehydrogenase NAD-binding domain-containing protein, partial [Pirellulales bacterium]|nr:3-hydroxyacyl-CoA dehydrogenase NAD-binding domain-containing protein [Pirellulales bacterium]
MADAGILSLQFPEPDIAVLTFDDPHKGANVLSSGVLAELARHLDDLEKRTGLAGLIIRSGKPGSFIAGADLREFAASFDVPRTQIVEMCHRGRKLFQRLSAFPAVTVAAIDGICVGGGAELAIWCDRRILTDHEKTQFGFPEVKLGLFPGWGGTARASRIVGLGNAVEMITSGESIDAHTAAAMNLANDVVTAAGDTAPLADRLLAAAIRMVRAEAASGDYRKDRQRWAGPIVESETELGFLGATASGYIQQKTGGHYPAPLAALEIMLGAAGLPIDAACDQEAEGMAGLFGTPVNRALINVFFLTDHNKKDQGVDRPGVAAHPVKSVSVIGAGIMGAGIVAANLRRQVPVAVSDAAEAALAGGVRQVLEEVSYNKQTKQPDAERAIRFAPLLNATTSDAELARADLVVEAVVENVDVKKKVYARLEPLLADTAVLASNTSTIQITKLAQGLKRPDRFVGIHFFNPVRKMPLVEVIRGRETSDETIATAVAYAKGIGKSPIVVHDGPGFLVNRLLFPYLNESLELLSEGASIKSIERASTEFGMPMGPLALYDMVGLDTSVYAGRVLWEAFPDRTGASPILPAMVKAGRLGQKSGRGFFLYRDKKGRSEPDPTLNDWLATYRRGERKFTS